MERYKSDLAFQIANERARLEESILRRSLRHEKRAAALVDLYGAFYVYLDFLRLHLYFDRQCMTFVTPAILSQSFLPMISRTIGRVAAGSYPPAAPSYGRNTDFSMPPAQIPACPLGHGAPTSGV